MINLMDYLPPQEDNSITTLQPHNREAEEAVLGAVLIYPEAYYDLSQKLKKDDFYIIRNQWVWEAYTTLIERRQKIDLLTVSDVLDEKAHLEEVGGQVYLTTLINQTPTSLHAQAYAEIVEENAMRRRMLEAANHLAKQAYDRGKSVNTLLDEAEKAVFGLSERRITYDVQPIRKVLDNYYDRIDRLTQQPDEMMGVLTGLEDIDDVLGGMQKSDLLIIAGRPGMGKTGFMLTVAKNAALKYKKHVAFFSLEMSNEQLIQRLIAQETSIDTQRLRKGHLHDDEWGKFNHAMEILGDAHIWLDDTPAITPLSLRTKCRRLHMEHQLDLVVVDYLQLMAGDIRTENRVQEVSYISRNLKQLARELNVPVLVGAQLSRAVEQRADKRPMLSDLRESGSLEQDSDIVMFIHRQDEKEAIKPEITIADLIVAKHRNGPTHPGLQLIFFNNFTRFANANKDKNPPPKPR